MANVFPFDVEVCDAPQGHGYSELQVDSPNPFFPAGTVLHGHEFHYSRIVGIDEPLQTACAVARGTGCISGRDSVVYRNTMASYTHLHALASPEWTKGFLTAACSFALRA
jgi:cobyrinic acid a,c-diamide synthase